MRAFIPSKGRAQTITTHRALDAVGVPWTIVVHTEQERQTYIETQDVHPGRIVVSGTEPDAYGLTRQREWICRELADADEWFLFADDNVVQIESVEQQSYTETELPVQDGRGEHWKAIYTHWATELEFEEILSEQVAEAERVGARWTGFATTDNPFFRGKKYRTVGYVIGKMTLQRNSGLTFDHTITMEDFRNTAEYVARDGAVLINNYVFPRARHYQGGGMGTYEERVPYRLRDVQRLLALYPGFFRVKMRKGFVDGTDVALRLTGEKQVAEWRQMMQAQLDFLDADHPIANGSP